MAEIMVDSLTDPVALYCIASTHDRCVYSWCKFGKADATFPNTPVLYVKDNGLYQCKVFKSRGRKHLESQVFKVEVQPSKFIISIQL